MIDDQWPTELRLGQGGKMLVVAFADGALELDAEYLRVSSPSAEVRGHSPAERKTVGGKCGVSIRAVEPVGNYAVRLVFDDGHDTGIYTWAYLRRLGVERPALWGAYLSQLERKGLSRDRPGQR